MHTHGAQSFADEQKGENRKYAFHIIFIVCTICLIVFVRFNFKKNPYDNIMITRFPNIIIDIIYPFK